MKDKLGKTLNAGDNVRFKHPKFGGLYNGEILKIKTRKVSVRYAGKIHIIITNVKPYNVTKMTNADS